jgi:hypothetical protein
MDQKLLHFEQVPWMILIYTDTPLCHGLTSLVLTWDQCKAVDLGLLTAWEGRWAVRGWLSTEG